SLEGNHLAFQFHSFQSALTHFQYDTFEANLGGGKTRVTFYLNADGNVAKLSAEGMQFRRVNERP
ncbi:MAG TPA: hypothetical protein VNF00_02290, partial [Candidatus Acidoferrales bacterium]|nr:hypothetical protein [Candidatus Acidoferrales bacterium]